MSADPDQLLAYVSCYYEGYDVTTAYEAGCCGYYAHRSFKSYGLRSLVVNPGDIYRHAPANFLFTHFMG